MAEPLAGQQAPRFSIVSAVYGVERYLADFIDSIEQQDFPLEQVEVVMVDDGSPDGSAQILADWQARRPELVRVLSQDNAGLSAARNAGIEQVTGEWVTFIDPDDMMAPSYLSEVDAALRQFPVTEMVATRRTMVFDRTGKRSPHALDGQFDSVNGYRDLDGHPGHFHGHAPSAFFRNEVLRRTGLRFDPRVRPNFEDGHFCIHYLLLVERPVVAFVTTAEYLYRKRADQSSVISRSQTDPGRYTTVLEHGYLDVLRASRSARGHVPEWVQTYIVYELSWYFTAADSPAGAPSAAYGATAARMHELMAQIVALLDPWVIEGFSLRAFPRAGREILLHAYDEAPWHSPFVVLDRLDTAQRLVRLSYRYTGSPPEEQFFSEGVEVRPAYAKTRGVSYFDRTLLHERIVWLPPGATRVRLGGAGVEVRFEEPAPPTYTRRLWEIRRRLVPDEATGRQSRQERTGAPRKASARAVVRLARSSLARRFFADAWVLMDRFDSADDSAELLFRFLRRRHGEVNAWFVIGKDVPDHRRLRKDSRRVLPHGSLRWKLLMLNCEQLVTSQADASVVRPPALRELAEPRWRTALVPSGVMTADHSAWLNPRDLDLLVTSTPAEHDAVVGDGSTYRYGERETVLAGLPRFDRLHRAGRKVPPEQRTLVVVAPTWRHWLVDRAEGADTPTVDPSVFAASDFARQWSDLLGSPALHALADRHGLTIALLLHPRLQGADEALVTSDSVQRLSRGSRDLRRSLARARVVVTDYSTTAFDAAYLERPVVYFQFDRERVQSGAHLGRPGYFDYSRDGFGPVAETCEGALAEITATLEQGPHPAAPYLSRIEQAFPERDGHCTRRVYRAIAQSQKPVPREPHTVERSRPSQ